MKKDFENIGERLENIESKMDETVRKVNQNSKIIFILTGPTQPSKRQNRGPGK